MKRWILVSAISLTFCLLTLAQQNVTSLEMSGDDWSGDDGLVTPRTLDIEGSAGGPITDDDTDEEVSLTPCQKQKQAAETGKLPGAFRPQCTPNGAFKQIQCDSKMRQCWCVNKDGKEITGSGAVYPSEPNCNQKPEIFVPARKGTGSIPEEFPEIHSTDDIGFVETYTPRSFDSDKTTVRKTSRVQTTTINVEDDHSDDTVNVQKQNFFAFLFKDPLVLAGIIGGAVLALLCIVLLVMFTIYRLRKKDEGSYALDEPKKSHGFSYTRARDQEFFA